MFYTVYQIFKHCQIILNIIRLTCQVVSCHSCSRMFGIQKKSRKKNTINFAYYYFFLNAAWVRNGRSCQSYALLRQLLFHGVISQTLSSQTARRVQVSSEAKSKSSRWGMRVIVPNDGAELLLTNLDSCLKVQKANLRLHTISWFFFIFIKPIHFSALLSLLIALLL